MFKSIRDWIEIRIGLDELVRTQLKEYRVPGNINIFYTLGFIALAAYIIQAVTGFFLLVYYIPSSDHAFMSVQNIMNRVPFGWLFRLMHVVGSNLMVAVVFLHMLSVFFMGSYKKPRELTWVAGGLMMLVTLAFCLSGYLLPWSQLSYWATTIVANLPTAFPVIGDFIAKLLRGGEQVSGITLNRFFAIHIAFLPPILVSIVGIHIFLVRRTGISSPPFGVPDKENNNLTEFRHESHPDGLPFYPYFVHREISMVMIYLALLFFIVTFMPTLFLPEDANTPADPFKTPAHIKPEWYFLAPYQMLKLIPNKFLGISLQVILVAAFLSWPFFDTKKERNLMKRPLLLSVFLISVAIYVLLTLWGLYS
ncbi:MAG: cytochrome bc complex cytochrome b subunit [Nitrospirota bacterium]